MKTYGGGKFSRVPSAITGNIIAAWFIPSKQPKSLGNILLVHGIGDHSRFGWFGHPEFEPFNDLWAQRKAEAEESTLADSNDNKNVRRVWLNPPDVSGHKIRITLRDEDVPSDMLQTISNGGEPVYEGGWAERLSAAGWNVCLYDHEGHGISAAGYGRCNIRDFGDLIRDCLQMWDLTNTEWPDAQRTCICGHSMGGLIVARALELAKEAENKQPFRWQRKPTFAILLAPALGLDEVSRKGINKFLKPMGTILSVVGPSLKLVSRAKNDDYGYIEKSISKDPLFHQGKLPCRLSTELLAASLKSQIETDGVPADVAILLCHSLFDGMCDPKGSQEWMNKISHVSRRELWLLDDGWHFLTLEPNNKILLDRIIEWLN